MVNVTVRKSRNNPKMQVYGWNELYSKVMNISWADRSYIKGGQLKWWLSQIKNHFCILYVTDLIRFLQ